MQHCGYQAQYLIKALHPTNRDHYSNSLSVLSQRASLAQLEKTKLNKSKHLGFTEGCNTNVTSKSSWILIGGKSQKAQEGHQL